MFIEAFLDSVLDFNSEADEEEEEDEDEDDDDDDDADCAGVARAVFGSVSLSPSSISE